MQPTLALGTISNSLDLDLTLRGASKKCATLMLLSWRHAGPIVGMRRRLAKRLSLRLAMHLCRGITMGVLRILVHWECANDSLSSPIPSSPATRYVILVMCIVKCSKPSGTIVCIKIFIKHFVQIFLGRRNSNSPCKWRACCGWFELSQWCQGRRRAQLGTHCRYPWHRWDVL